MNDTYSTTTTNTTVVLVLTHLINREISALFQKINEECGSDYDVVFLCDNSRGVFSKHKNDKNYFLFTTTDLNELNCPGKNKVEYEEVERRKDVYHKHRNFVPGNTELPVMLFARRKPQYRYYWIIEYDVRFSGSWKSLFSYFARSDADLLATTIIRRQEIPHWPWWPSLDLGEKNTEIDLNDHLRAFFPAYRISNRALHQLELDYQSAVKGTYECLMPTLLYHANLKIEDIGGAGEFVKKENVNRFYRNTPTNNALSPGTFVFRPTMDWPGKEPNKLWHPVKQRPYWRIALSLAKRTALSLIGRTG